ncbi:MAG: acetamidase/formamidase family protein [Hyphomicrobiales bacterium]|nr:acetamidase/formamidase family protein [Hyphomicrobiales bacterium]
MPTHHLPATPETMIWGTLSADTPPVLRIDSGDTVSLACVPAGGAASFPADLSRVPAAWRTAVETMTQGPGAHFVTGPVFVKGAMPGDVLQVEILEAKPAMDFGFVSMAPLLGTLVGEFPDAETIHPPIDRAKGTCALPWGTELPLDPFFGVIGTAPPANWGKVSTNIPRSFGGNMDNKELKPGTTLYLPVFAEGALFYAGDGHGVQGDGEVCVTAIETGLIGTFRLTVINDLTLTWPRAETPTHVMTMAFDPDLDDCVVIALREMIGLIAERTGLSRQRAYMLASLAADVRVTQVVNGSKGAHVMLPKSCLHRA